MSKDQTKSKAHAIINEDFVDNDALDFMVHTREKPLEEAWYMDKGANDHMTDRLEWFDTFTNIPLV